MIGNRAQLTEKIGSGRIIAIGGIDRFISHRGATILDATYKFDR